MLQLKTHFERVPLEIVRTIVEEQIRRETAIEPDQGFKKRTLEDLFGAQEQSRVRSSTFLRRRLKQ
jgi:hypothetical protein